MKEKRVTKWSMFCYGLGDLASQFGWTSVGSYLTIFYTDVVGLAPVAVSAIMLCARIWDGINDPMMGAIAERTKSRFGRFRPYIAFGSPFLALAIILTFTAPFGNGTKGIAWAAVTYIIAGMLYTLVNIPYGALAGVMTTDADERNKINACRSVGMGVGMILINVCSSFIMLAFSNGAKVATGRGYFMTAMIYCIISVPLFWCVFLGCKERIMPGNNDKKIPLKVTIKNIVSNKYLILVFAIVLLQMTAFMGRIAITTYYVIYCLGAFTLIAVIMTIPAIGGTLASFFVAPLMRKFGKKRTLMTGLAMQGVGLLIVYLAPFDNLVLVIIGHIIFGAFNLAFPITLSMTSDAIDYQELKSGVRTDGTSYAMFTLASKAGNAVGGAVGALLLGFFGYQANIQQSAETLRGINFTVNLLPAILFFLGALVCFFWDLSDSDSEEIRRQLEEKRSNNN